MSQSGSPVPAPPPAPPNDPGSSPEVKRNSAVRNAAEWIVIIVGALLVAFVVKTFLIQAFYIPSASMLPTLEENDRVLVNKLSYDLHEVQRGDIVVFKSPDNDGPVKDLIKRVVGLPGDTVESRDGQMIVNGEPIQEDYLGPGITTSLLEPTKIPADHYWVMGDNRGNSKDSRVFGPIDESLIIGRAFVKVWPLNHIRWFSSGG